MASSISNTSTHPRGIAYLESLPVEMIHEIMKQMGPSELTRFVLLSKTLLCTFEAHQTSIMCQVLQKQPEIGIMLTMYTMHKRDLVPGQMLFPRSVKLDPRANGANYPYDRSMVIHLFTANVPDNWPVVTGKFLLQTCDLVRLWNLFKVVDWWVELYPTLRWRDEPENRRCLRPHEEVRLRKAVARWWLYAHHFHGSTHRDVYRPLKWRDDHRLHHMRVMSTREICELEDLWALVFEMVSKDLCSSPERIPVEGGHTVELVPWGADDGRHARIVNTYLKFDPQELKGFFDGVYPPKKWDIIRTARATTREFNLDSESMSYAITTVLEERIMAMPKGITAIPRSGIVDEDRDVIEVKDPWNSDASPNGMHPLTRDQIRAYPREPDKRLPNGDDGSDEPY